MKTFFIVVGLVAVLLGVAYLVATCADERMEDKREDYDESLF